MVSDLVDAYEDVSFSREEVLLHSSPFYEMLYCCSGNIQYLPGTNRYRIRHGDILIILPGTSHRPLYLETLTEPYRRYLLWIAPKFVKQVTRTWPDLVGNHIPHTFLFLIFKSSRATKLFCGFLHLINTLQHPLQNARQVWFLPSSTALNCTILLGMFL